MAVVTNQPIRFARQSYPTTARQLSAQSLVNMYAESTGEEVKGDNGYVLYNTQGLKTWLDFSLAIDIPINGLKKVGDLLFVIIGIDVYTVQTNKVFNLVGTLTSSSSQRFQLSQNGTQLTIIDRAGNAYVATSSTVTLVTDPNYLASVDTEFIDGFTIYAGVDLGSGRKDGYLISALDNSLVVDDDFSSAESEPDKIVGVKKYNGQLWLFGSETIEVHQNTGNQDFPFERISGAILDKGCLATASIAQDEKYLAWLGNDKIFYMAQGYGYQPIASKPITQAVEQLTTIEDAFSFIHIQDGHKTYTTTFPTAKKTLSYDITENLWHERKSLDLNGDLVQWRANNYEIFAGKSLVGDFEKGIIYEVDTDTFVEGDQTLISELVSKIISSKSSRFNIHRLELDFDAGLGTLIGQGENPQVMLQLSVDGGRTYGPELWRDLGKQGEYRTRAEWRQLGIADVKGMTFKIKISDPVRRALLGAYIDYEELAV